MRMTKDKTFLSVDPGVGGTGWALFDGNVLRYTGTITPTLIKDEWIDRMFSISLKFHHVLASYPGCDAVVMECPAFHGGVGGMVVAASGDLVKLSLLTGSLLQVCRIAGFTPALIKPAEWKGQLPKNVTHDRIKDILKMPLADVSEHARDAIGLGLWALGRF